MNLSVDELAVLKALKSHGSDPARRAYVVSHTGEILGVRATLGDERVYGAVLDHLLEKRLVERPNLGVYRISVEGINEFDSNLKRLRDVIGRLF